MPICTEWRIGQSHDKSEARLTFGRPRLRWVTDCQPCPCGSPAICLCRSISKPPIRKHAGGGGLAERAEGARHHRKRWYFIYHEPSCTNIKISADRDPQTGQ